MHNVTRIRCRTKHEYQISADNVSQHRYLPNRTEIMTISGFVYFTKTRIIAH